MNTVDKKEAYYYEFFKNGGKNIYWFEGEELINFSTRGGSAKSAEISKELENIGENTYHKESEIKAIQKLSDEGYHVLEVRGFSENSIFNCTVISLINNISRDSIFDTFDALFDTVKDCKSNDNDIWVYDLVDDKPNTIFRTSIRKPLDDYRFNNSLPSFENLGEELENQILDAFFDEMSKKIK